MIPKILTKNDPTFPDVTQALASPNGLLAAGGDLSVWRLIDAYTQGIFPWFMHNQPILWWSPDPRAVLFLRQLRLNRSLKKILRHINYVVTVNRDFQAVISNCAKPRKNQSDTWITQDMQDAYCRLHEAGRAHSIEVWEDDHLIGGLYGVDCGQVFAGESMFSLKTNASKIAFIYLAKYLEMLDYTLIDCQLSSSFLKQFGVQEIPRASFQKFLRQGYANIKQDHWTVKTLPNPVL